MSKLFNVKSVVWRDVRDRIYRSITSTTTVQVDKRGKVRVVDTAKDRIAVGPGIIIKRDLGDVFCRRTLPIALRISLQLSELTERSEDGRSIS
jgi:hypothetical protein